MVYVFVIVVIFVFSYFWFKSSYSNFLLLDTEVKLSWLQVENELKHRDDLMPNYGETVMRSAKPGDAILIDVMKTRTKIGESITIPDKIAAHNKFTLVLKRFMSEVECYPDYKSNQNYQRILNALAATGENIDTKRKKYNENVRTYNEAIRFFPCNIMASMSGFEKGTELQEPTTNYMPSSSAHNASMDYEHDLTERCKDLIYQRNKAYKLGREGNQQGSEKARIAMLTFDRDLRKYFTEKQISDEIARLEASGYKAGF